MTSVSDNQRGILDDCRNRSITVENVPFYYSVHLNMPCNQGCIMCLPDGNHSPDLLTFDKFLTFFDQIKPSPNTLR